MQSKPAELPLNKVELWILKLIYLKGEMLFAEIDKERKKEKIIELPNRRMTFYESCIRLVNQGYLERCEAVASETATRFSYNGFRISNKGEQYIHNIEHSNPYEYLNSIEDLDRSEYNQLIQKSKKKFKKFADYLSPEAYDEWMKEIRHQFLRLCRARLIRVLDYYSPAISDRESVIFTAIVYITLHTPRILFEFTRNILRDQADSQILRAGSFSEHFTINPGAFKKVVKYIQGMYRDPALDLNIIWSPGSETIHPVYFLPDSAEMSLINAVIARELNGFLEEEIFSKKSLPVEKLVKAVIDYVLRAEILYKELTGVDGDGNIINQKQYSRYNLFMIKRLKNHIHDLNFLYQKSCRNYLSGIQKGLDRMMMNLQKKCKIAQKTENYIKE